ncbi:hypothetical protein [Shimazuella soli]|uniref:hypothetical protein n=1 Tax=Shimazuella soli TaxID=1892854 RepID=UPI001F0E1AF1|nr:hypothetical protein [Shimazuella soli]
MLVKFLKDTRNTDIERIDWGICTTLKKISVDEMFIFKNGEESIILSCPANSMDK